MPPQPRLSSNRGALIPENRDDHSFDTVPSYRGGTENKDFYQNSTRSRDNNRINNNPLNYEVPDYERQRYQGNNGNPLNRNNQSFIGPQRNDDREYQRNNDRERHFNPNNQKERILTDNSSESNSHSKPNFNPTATQSNSRNSNNNGKIGGQSQNISRGQSSHSKTSNIPRNGTENQDMQRNQNHNPNISNNRGMNNQQYRGGMGGYGGMGGGYGNMGMGSMYGMGGMGMGMGMGMMGPFSWIYSLNNIIHSIPMMVDVLGMNSQMIYDLYNQILALLMKLINLVKRSDFRRFLQQKSRRSRALRIIFIVISMGLASQAIRLVRLLSQYDFSQNRLLTNM